MLSEFVRTHCHHAPGQRVFFKDLISALNKCSGVSLSPKLIIAQLAAMGIPYGATTGNRRAVGNISFTPPSEASVRTYIAVDGRLRLTPTDTTFARNEIRRLRAACYTFAAIADRLNELGFTTATGKPWTKQTAASELRNHGG